MTDPELAAHLVDVKYLLVALVVATVAAEATATAYDGNGTTVALVVGLALLPIGFVYVVFESPSRTADGGA